MKKTSIVALALVGLFITGWNFRPAFNRPKSVVVNAASTTIPTAFSDAAGSLVLQGLSSGAFQHLMVTNYSNAPLSILTLPDVSTAPSATVTGQRLHIVSSGVAAFDDVSIFENLYIQSEEMPVTTKKVYITVW